MLKPCLICHQKICKYAEFCPQCGSPNNLGEIKSRKKRAALEIGFPTIVSFVLAVGFHLYNFDKLYQLTFFGMAAVLYLMYQYELHKKYEW